MCKIIGICKGIDIFYYSMLWLAGASNFYCRTSYSMSVNHQNKSPLIISYERNPFWYSDFREEQGHDYYFVTDKHALLK